MPPAVVAIGAAVATAAVQVGVATAVISATLGAVLTLAISVAAMVLTKKPRVGSSNQGSELRLKLDPSMPRQLPLGRCATGGSVVWSFTYGFRQVDGPDNDIYNRYLVRIIALSDLPINGVVKVLEGKDILTFSGDIHSTLAACNQHKDKLGTPRMMMRVYRGSPNAVADANVMSWNNQWTANHKGTNMAYAIVRYDYDPDAFPNGEPQLVFVLDGVSCYDDRQDGSKVGRTGTQRLNDPTTWTYTRNASVITAQCLRGFYSNGSLLFGAQAEERDLSDSMLLSAYNTCDEDADNAAGGVQPRYRAGLLVSCGEPLSNALVELKAAMDGELLDRGGAITILPGATRTPVFNLTDEDIIWTEEKSWQPRSTLSELFNYIAGTFIDEETGFQERPFPTLWNDQWEIDDGGERFQDNVSFKAINDWSQVQRITKRMHEATRFQGTVAFVLPLWALEMEQGDWFTHTSTRFKYTTKYFEAVTCDLATNLSVVVIAKEVSPTIDGWAPAVDEKPRNDTIWTSPNYDLLGPTITVTGISVLDSTTLVESVGLSINIGSMTNYFGPSSIELEYAPTSDLASAIRAPSIAPVNQTTSIMGLLPNTSYSVRARSTDGQRFSTWSAWVAATTPAITLAPADTVGADINTNVVDSYTGTKITVPRNELKTSLGIASGIAGQGYFATRNSVAYGDAALTGFGGLAARSSLAYGDAALTGFGSLAARSNVRFGNEVKRADGTTTVGDADAITSLGVASAIAGQTAWATSPLATGRLNNLSDTGIFNSLGNITTRNLNQLNGRAWTNLFRANGATAITDADAITSLGTASAIAGQGSLATKSTVTYGTGDVTGFGTLAARNTARLENEVVDSGGGFIGRSALVTSLGTAAAITGQGAFATRSTISTDADLSGNLAARLAPFASDPNYLTAERVAWVGGDTVQAWKPGEGGANKTETRVAAAIAGQGSLATKSSVAYGTSDVTGFGPLAKLSRVRLGTEDTVNGFAGVANEGNSYWLTDSVAVTSMGTAASIAGQGSLATISRSNIVSLSGSENLTDDHQPNLIYNGGLRLFNTNTNWPLGISQGVNWSYGTGVNEGPYIQRDAAGTSACPFDFIRVYGSAWYNLQAEMYDGGNGGTLNFDIEWWSDSGGSPSAIVGYSTRCQSGHNVGWNKQSVVVQAPSTALWAKLRVFTENWVVGPGPAAIRRMKLAAGLGNFLTSSFSDEATNSVDLLTKSGTGRRLADGTNQTSNRNYGLRSLFSGLTFTDTWVGTNNVTINVPASSFDSDFGTTLNLPSGSITGRAAGTKYYIDRLMPDPTSASGSYEASTTLQGALGTGKVYLGYWTTRASSGASGGGGGPGVGDCVASNAFVPAVLGEVIAELVNEGTPIKCLKSHETLETEFVKVERNHRALEACVTLISESGIRLTLACNSPLELPDMQTVLAPNGKGVRIPFEDENGRRLEEIVEVLYAGQRYVSHISVGGRVYAAGDKSGRYAYTHNTVKP